MFGTIRRYEAIDQNRTNELVKKAEDTLLPRLSELPGFNGYYLIEAGNGVIRSVGFFDTPHTRSSRPASRPTGCASRRSRPPFRIRRRSPTDRSSCTRPASS